MPPPMRWYRTLAWTFFLRQAAAIGALIAFILWVAYSEAERGARSAATSSLSAARYVLERAFEQQGRSLDAGLEVFTQYSGNTALVEQALESGGSTSLADALAENLPRLGADLALVVRPDGSLLAGTGIGGHPPMREVGILQMALAPEEAAVAGHPGPFYRGFLRMDWGSRPGLYHAVARPLRSPGGGALGAMLVGVRVDDRAALDLRRVAIAGPRRGDPAPHLALLSRFETQGSTLGGAGDLDRLLARDPALLTARAQVLDGQGSGVLPLQVGGHGYLGTITPIRGVNALDLQMAELLLLPVEPLLAPFRNLQRGILLAGALGLLAALGLSLRSARKVTAPLKALAAASEALAAGNAPDALALVPTPDEVGVLTRTFRSMVAELRAKDELLALLATARTGTAFPAPAGPRADEPTRRLAPLPPAPEEPLPPALRPGATFAGRYRVERLLGGGGMGLVLQVQDLQLEEIVALKVVRAALASDPAYLERLKQEIRLARKITHRFVLRTHDFGESEGIPFVTMEYLRGTTLRDLLEARGRLPLPLVLRIARQVAEGLEAAHQVGVVHRDIKPANVLFDLRGDAKIMDFGLAAPVAGSLGDAGHLIGSPRYMSPEQIRSGRVDARTDLYALGVMLFELCSGRPPFESARMDDLLLLHLDARPPALADAVPDLPPELGHLVARLMEKLPEDRPQSAAEVAEILKLLASGSGATSRL